MKEGAPKSKPVVKSHEQYYRATDFSVNAEKAENAKKAEAENTPAANPAQVPNEGPIRVNSNSWSASGETPIDKFKKNREKFEELMQKVKARWDTPKDKENTAKAPSQKPEKKTKGRTKEEWETKLDEKWADFKTNEKFEFIEGAKQTTSAESKKEADTAARYFELEKKSHLKNKTLRPTRAKLEEAKKAYNEARINRKLALEEKVKEELRFEFGKSDYEKNIKEHYEKLLERKGGKGNKALKGDKEKIPTFEEYKARFEKRNYDRYNKLVNIYEVGLPHAQRKLDARVERLGNKGQNPLQKGLSKLAEFRKAGEERIAKSVEGREFKFGKYTIKISESRAQQIGRMGMRAATSLGIATAITTGIVGGGAIFGAMSGSAALAYLGFKGARTALNVFGGTVGGIGAGEAYQAFTDRFGGAADLNRKKKSYIGSQHSLEEFDKSLEKNNRQAIAQKRRIAEALGASAVTLGFSLDQIYEATNHFSGATESVEKLAEIKHLAGHAHEAGTGVTKAAHAAAQHSGVHETTGAHPSKPEAASGAKSEAPASKSPAEAVPNKVSTAVPEKIQLEIGGANAENVTLNNANKLFGHFGELLQKDFAHMPHPPAAVEAYLKALQPHEGASLLSGENHFSKLMGFEGKYPLSQLMHKGDVISLDPKGQIVIQWADHARTPHVLFDSTGKPNTNFDDLQKYIRPVHAQTPNGTKNTLPAGMDPDSAAAADYLTKHAEQAAEASRAAHSAATVSPDVAHASTQTSAPPAAPSAAASIAADHAQAVAAPAKDASFAPNGIRSLNTPPVHHDVTASETVHAPAPTPETSSAPVFDGALIPKDIDTIMHSPAWSNYKNLSSSDAFSIYPEDGDAAALSLRRGLFDLVRNSGVGPLENQTIEDYISSATKALKGVLPTTNTFNLHTHVFQVADGHLQIHGGDLNARMAVANEYYRLHPDAKMVIEDPGGATPLFIFPPVDVGNGIEHLQPVTIKMSDITPTDKIVF